MSVSFGYLIIKENDFAVILPCTIGIIGTIFVSVLTFIEFVLGRKSFSFESEKIYVKRKYAIINIIEKKDIKNLMFIYDMVLENLYMISFVCNGKKYHIPVNSDKESIIYFFDGMTYKKQKNYLYYFFEIFSI